MKFLCVALLLAMVAFVASSEEALPPCLCSRIYSPVCASNGKTYASKCEFRCHKTELQRRDVVGEIDLKIVRTGACDGPEIPELEDIFE